MRFVELIRKICYNFIMKTCFELFWTFFKIGSVTFGGGLAMLPILERELVAKRGWISETELVDYYAIGQTTPGIIAVNVATFCGHKRAGVLGGVFSTLGIAAPSVIVICLLANFISSIDGIPVIKKALKGINVAVAANLSFSVLKLTRKTLVSLLSVALFLAAFTLIYFFKVNTVLVIFAAALLGILIMKLGGNKS